MALAAERIAFAVRRIAGVAGFAAGSLDCGRRGRGAAAGSGGRSSAAGPGAGAPVRYEAVAASKDDRSAIVLGSGVLHARLLELIDERGRTSLGVDRIVATSASQAQSTAAYAGSVRLREGSRGERQVAVWSLGTEEGLIWLDARASNAGLHALLSDDDASCAMP